jgi:drug/metabolite transporter (DMT)-like permease
MTLGVLLVVLLAALLHASWNLLVKAGRDTHFATAGVYIGGGVIGALLLPFLAAPARASWPCLGVATALELLYGTLLAATYRVGDLSHAYPLMRGAAPLLVAIGSGVLIGEHLSGGTWLGITLVSCGIFSMIFDARARGHSATATRLALLNALVIAAYTTVDGIGVRLSGHPITYSLWLSVLIAVPWSLWVTARRRVHRALDLTHELPRAAVGAVFSVAAYTLVLWAMTRAPVAAVAAVRETAIVFATALGALALHERVSRVRAVAALAIALGVWVIRAH